MSSSDEPTERHLLDAVIFWGDDVLLAAVARAEAIFTDSELRGMGYSRLGSASCGAADEYMDQSERIQARIDLSHVWNALLEDFRRRIHGGRIFLSGVQVRPEMQQFRVPIPSVWASDFEFDFFKDQVTIGIKYRYIGVMASRTPSGPSAHSAEAIPPPATISPETVSELDTETILALLEECANRIIADGTSKKFPPGHLTVMPLIQGKMRYRAERGELLATMIAEAEWLHDWASSKSSLQSVPTVLTIKKVLSKEYSLLKARSKRAIQ